MSNCHKALRFVIYCTDYEADRPFSHVIQVFILIFLTDTVSATQNLKNVRVVLVNGAQLPMIVERMATVALAQ